MPRLRLAAALALIAALAAAVGTARPRPGHHGGKVKLAVLVVFDQMRGDYIEKWEPLFGPGGFRRLTADGAVFTDCNYPYATTSTGPGHASMLTGATPDRHGIVNNEWYDRAAAEDVYCAGSDRYQPVPAGSKPAAGKKPKPAGTPDRLLSPTVGDELKRATRGAGKVFGVSLKDRSAIFPAGHRPDGAFWFGGKFVTSNYYSDTLPGWVERFNGSGAADRWKGAQWDRLRPDLDYAAFSGPDDGPGEGEGEPAWGDRTKPKPVRRQGATFPHPMDVGTKTPGEGYAGALANSPFGNELLLAFAEACVTAEKLGADDVPDLLTVSFSSNDLVGHTWGPDSQEVLDVTLRSDRQLARLLSFLDARVGRGAYSVIVTADHGICPLPEASRAKGVPAERVHPGKLHAGAEEHLRKVFGTPPAAEKVTVPKEEETKGKKGHWVEKVSPPWVYLNDRLLREKGVPRAAAAAEAANWLRTQPGVGRVFTAADIAVGSEAGDELAERVRRAYYPGRSGDVYVTLKPYHLFSDPLTGTGTSHGTPHPYDTHVPLIVYGPGVEGGKRDEPVTPEHAAAVAAYFLGIPPPRDAAYGLPATLFGEEEE